MTDEPERGEYNPVWRTKGAMLVSVHQSAQYTQLLPFCKDHHTVRTLYLYHLNQVREMAFGMFDQETVIQ